MGGAYSTIPEPDSSQPYFALTFVHPDKIKIVLADRETIDIVRRACIDRCPRGLRRDAYAKDRSYHLKFVGTPFAKECSSLKSAVNVRNLAVGILSELNRAGWELELSSQLGRFRDFSTWFFRRSVNEERQPVSPSVFCLACNWADRLTLIGADQSTKEILKSVVQNCYDFGIQGERTYPIGGGCYELQLSGWPWHSRDKMEQLYARKTLLEFIRQIHQKRYRLYATVNLKGTADSMFFIHRPNIDTSRDRFCVISLNSVDLLRMVDCPAEVIDATRRAIVQFWPYGLQKETEISMAGNRDPILQIQLRGNPWFAHGIDTVYSRSFLTNLFSQLMERGWTVASSLDVGARIDDKSVFVLRANRLKFALKKG